MKVAIIFAAVIVGCLAQATEEPTMAPFVCPEGTNAFVCKLKEIGHTISHHGKKLGSKLKDVGTSILTAATEQGSNLLASGSKAILGTILEHLNKSGLIGKRDMSFFEKVKGHLQKGKEFLTKMKAGLKAAFEKAVDKLTGMVKDVATMKIEKDTEKKIDETVDDFKKEGKTGFAAIAAGIREKLKAIFMSGMEKLRAHMKGDDKEKRALLSDLLEKAKGHFKNLTAGLAETFKPHLDALTQGIKGLAGKAKEHAGKLLQGAKDSLAGLKTKLGGHIDTLKGHAKTLGTHATNALAALKEAVTSIAKQALSNAQGTLTDAAKTGVDAAGVITDHLSGN